MFKTILASTDMQASLDAPVLSAARLAGRLQARLFLTHVLEPISPRGRPVVHHFETGEKMFADYRYTDRVREKLSSIYHQLFSGIDYEIRVLIGSPWQQMLTLSKEIDSDLIVLGPHSACHPKDSSFSRSKQVGSTAENVITHESCPVMIVNHPIDEAHLSFRHIMVGVDFSRSCECAVCFAALLGHCFKSRLTVFHMIPVPPFPKYSHASYRADAKRTERRLYDHYQKYLDETESSYLIRAGALPHVELLNSADQQEADLIILGSHTKERSGKWYPGSVVERVSSRSTRPLMIITDPEVLTHWHFSTAADMNTTKDRQIHLFTAV